MKDMMLALTLIIVTVFAIGFISGHLSTPKPKEGFSRENLIEVVKEYCDQNLE